VIKEECFPADPEKAIINGFAKAEKIFIELVEEKYEKTGILETSGSCAITLLFVGMTKDLTILDDMCYVANVGDSRAVLSKKNGTIVEPLSIDQRPLRNVEMKRITENGGHIYRYDLSLKVEGHQQWYQKDQIKHLHLVLIEYSLEDFQ
jgi:protein phosphatase 2C family protein 2/3